IKCIYGYFQSENYFSKHRKVIQEELMVKTPPTSGEKSLLKQIQSSKSVALSMRLGEDYTDSKALNICRHDYYDKAIDYMRDKLEDPIFYVFSDRIDIVKKSFSFKHDVIYVEGFKDYESLRLMYSCKHFVISNSSFSWWGAYLSANNDKIVVAPSRWYNMAKEVPDIYLESMKLLEV
ncbi:alpha-1,2-fucosyltransferase, partial [Schleiferiaceae bacterium]|nr:alpha-1,2-fucosyltransferase [Schleiferiaceae bacterium]